MFDTLIESHPKRDRTRFLSVGFASLVVHAVVVGGAIVATLNVGQSDTGE